MGDEKDIKRADFTTARDPMIVDQIPILRDLPPGLQEVILRTAALIVALALIWGTRKVLSALVIAPVRQITKRTRTDIDDRLLDAMLVPVRLIIIAMGIQLSIEVLLPNDSLFSTASQVISRTLIAMALLIGVYRFVDIMLISSRQVLSLTGIRIEDQLLPFVRVSIKLFIMAVGLVILLQVWGFDISGLIAGIGIGGLGISLAAQDTIANLFGFISIVGDRPFDVGDFIKTTDVEGLVEHVGLRSTRVRQQNQALVTLPNNKLANSAILNWSRLYKRQVNFVLGVTYTTSVDQMRELLTELRNALAARETVQADSVVVYFTTFGSSSLDILVRCFVLIADWAQFTAEQELINLQIMDIVRDHGLDIAFPTQTVYVQNVPDDMLPRSPAQTRQAQKQSTGDASAAEQEPIPNVSQGSDSDFDGDDNRD